MEAELSLGLRYDSNIGRLTVQVLKGSQFGFDDKTNKPPNSFIKLALYDFSGDVIVKSKSSVRPAQPNPLFEETFRFQLPSDQLPDVSLVVCVYRKVMGIIKKQEMIGWFAMGAKSSGEDETQHWQDMLQNVEGTQVTGWHILLKPDAYKNFKF